MDRLVMLGFVTVKVSSLLPRPPTQTFMFTAPLRPDGTSAVMEVLFHAVVWAVTPVKLTKLDPLVAPKLFPVMMTELPCGPETGERCKMDGAVGLLTVNVTDSS